MDIRVTGCGGIPEFIILQEVAQEASGNPPRICRPTRPGEPGKPLHSLLTERYHNVDFVIVGRHDMAFTRFQLLRHY